MLELIIYKIHRNNKKNRQNFEVLILNFLFPEGRSCHPDLSGGGAFQVSLSQLQLGMISHKKSLITIFGHKHKIKNFIKKFDIFHEKISTAFDFGLYLE